MISNYLKFFLNKEILGCNWNYSPLIIHKISYRKELKHEKQRINSNS